MMFDGEFAEPWGDGEARESRFCFIGKNLDKGAVLPAITSPLTTGRFRR